jgi:hypothetical protein
MSCAIVRTISRRFSIQHLWAVVILAGVFVFVNTHPIRPHDFWWHMAVGREILGDGQIPKVDIYSYTAYGSPYLSYQIFWLMEIVLYQVYQVGGATLVVFFQSLVITSTYLLVLLTCLHRSLDWRTAAFGTAFAAALGLNDWNVRPQAITFLIGVLFLFLIQKLRSGSKPGWAILFPMLMVIWVNSHGTFPLGIFFLSLWLGDEVWKLLYAKWKRENVGDLRRVYFPGLILLVSSLACLINPGGIGILNYLRSLLGNSIVQDLVVEWAPPKFDTFGGGLFFASLLFTIAVVVFSPRKLTFFQLFGFLGLATLACFTSRGIIWFGLMMAPVVAENGRAIWVHLHKDQKTITSNQGRTVVNWMFMGVILALALITLPWFKEQLPMPEAKAGLISSETPVQATAYLIENRPPGNIFHAMSFGSYLIWAAQPEYRVFVDGRIELYPQDVWLDYLEISNAVGDWEGKLEAYGVHTLLISWSEQADLVNAALASDRWVQVFEDNTALVFVSQ